MRAREVIAFVDRVHGRVEQDLGTTCGDFIIRRADGLFAYQLAVVVDDAAAGVTDIVRGGDLLDSTPRQIHLQQRLGLGTPRYAHLPLIRGPDGRKLSKSLADQPVNPDDPLPALHAVWQRLGQRPIDANTVDRFWPSAISNFDLRRVPAST